MHLFLRCTFKTHVESIAESFGGTNRHKKFRPCPFTQVNTSEKRRLFVFHEFEIFQFILYRVYVDLFFRHSGQLDIKKKYYSWDVMF